MNYLNSHTCPLILLITHHLPYMMPLWTLPTNTPTHWPTKPVLSLNRCSFHTGQMKLPMKLPFGPHAASWIKTHLIITTYTSTQNHLLNLFRLFTMLCHTPTTWLQNPLVLQNPHLDFSFGLRIHIITTWQLILSRNLVCSGHRGQGIVSKRGGQWAQSFNILLK